MPQDAYTLKKLNKELSSLLTGGKISRINQPEKDALSLLIYTAAGTVKLDIGLSARFCRISVGEKTTYENPKNAPNFCMLLRKHLQNAEIKAVGQVGFERVIYFDFLCFSEFSDCEMRLYLEIMGKYSNAVLTKDGVIVGALKTTSLESAKRVTLTGAKYVLPEKQDKADPTCLKELEELFYSSGAEGRGDMADFLSAHVAGLAYVTAREIADLYGGKPTAKDVYDYVNGGEISPCITYSGGLMQDFKARSTMQEKEPFPTLLQAQAAFYDRAITEKKFGDEKRRLGGALDGAVKKCEKLLAQINCKLAECEKTDEAKLCGELIIANIYAIKKGQKELVAANYYDEKGGEITIKLDERLTPSQNAERYYKKYAKLKRTKENLTVRKEEAAKRLNYLLSVRQSLQSAENTDDLQGVAQELSEISAINGDTQKGGQRGKAQKNAEPPFRTYSYGGFTVICGRNNVQNDKLTRSLSDCDVWLHTKTFHSSHVGIITQGRQADDGVIKFAAEVCAYYSEAREKDKVQVDFTLKKHVKRPGGAPRGFVVYTDFKTVNVTPARHAEAKLNE